MQPRSDDAQAFIPDPDERGWSRVSDDLAETLGEGFVASATTGENVEDEALEAVVPEEIGGPFIETTDAQEFGLSTDDMNPEDAEPEPLPRAVSGLVSTPMPEVVEAQLAASGAAAADGSEAVDESDDGGADMLRSERLVDGDEIT